MNRPLNEKLEALRHALEEAVDPKKALTKLLKAAEKDLKSAAGRPDVGLHIWQETREARGGYGPYEVGYIMLANFKVSITVDLTSGDVSMGAQSGPHTLESMSSKGTMKDASARLKKVLARLKDMLPAAKPETPKLSDKEAKLAAMKSALSGRVTKTGGRLILGSTDAQGADFEPQHRQRLDHYGTSYSDDGDEQEGWDSEGWEDDYARPLSKEVEALLAAAGVTGFVVDIGEKGHVYVQLPS